MADKRQPGRQNEGEEVPAFFKNMGSGSPKPRQKFCGMFCPVEGSSENKTINFGSLSGGKGSGKIISEQKDVSPSDGRKIEIKCSSGKEALQYHNDKVGDVMMTSMNMKWRRSLLGGPPRQHRQGGNVFHSLLATLMCSMKNDDNVLCVFLKSIWQLARIRTVSLILPYS